MVFHVVLVVDGQVILERVDGVLRLFVGLGPLHALDDHVGNPVPELWRGGCVPLPHLLSQLHVGLLGCVVGL